jgi:dolichol-phosphate mannosyltransferase
MNLSIVIPAFNERENLPGLLDDLERLRASAPCDVEVVVVDDGSTDGTADLLRAERERRSWLRPLASVGNGGMGAALKRGTAASSHPLVAWVMADRSDRLDDLWAMREKLLRGADLVVASRAMDGGSYGDLVGPKSLGSRCFSGAARALLRLPVHDSTNAFRAFRRTLLERVSLARDDFAISPEMVFAAVRLGMRVAEVPTVYSFRDHGMSQFALLRMGLAYARLALRSWREARRPAEGRG